MKDTFSKIHVFPRSHQNEFKMTPKWSQNGAKQRLWTQIGAIMTSLKPQRDLEIGSRNLEIASCNRTLLLWKLKVASKSSKKVSNCSKKLKKQTRDTKKVKKSVKLKKTFYGIFLHWNVVDFEVSEEWEKWESQNPAIAALWKQPLSCSPQRSAQNRETPLSFPIAGNTSRCGGVASAFLMSPMMLKATERR